MRPAMPSWRVRKRLVRCGCLLATSQQRGDVAIPVCRQSRQYILEIRSKHEISIVCERSVTSVMMTCEGRE